MLNDQTLFFGLPIKLDNNTTLYQPTLKEILDKGFMMENILEPFITLDKRNFENEKDNDKINNFDMLFIQMILAYMQYLEKEKEEKLTLSNWVNSDKSNILVIKRLIEVIKFLCKTDDVILSIEDISNGSFSDSTENHILINKSYKINRDTFEDFKKLVCEIFDTEIKIEKKPQKTEEELYWEKIFAEKRKAYEKKFKKNNSNKEKNKDNLTIFTLINYIIHYKDSQYNYNSIKELTIYQIKNTFKYYQSQEMYEIDIRYRTSGQFKMENKSEHWFFDK